MLIFLLLVSAAAAAPSPDTSTTETSEIDVPTTLATSAVAPTESSKFASRIELYNVNLVFGENKLKVSKEFLAIHSPVFAELFHGDFADKKMSELEMKDVSYEEFVALLQIIYPGRTLISDHNVLSILKLGDRFKMETHLLSSVAYSNTKKLHLADQYKLNALKSTPEYAQFSDALKAAICDQLMIFIKNTPNNSRSYGSSYNGY